jgi:selenium metabolism protein YedF
VDPVQAEPGGDGKKILVLVAADSLGKGDDELGRKIVVNFIRTLKEMGDDLWRLVLLNSGVKLAVAGSEVLSQLQELAGKGLGILVCGPCLKTFNLLEQKQVGELTSMVDIVTSMQMADKVISLA